MQIINPLHGSIKSTDVEFMLREYWWALEALTRCNAKRWHQFQARFNRRLGH